MYEDFVPERLAKLRTQKGVSARDMSLSLGQANNYINNIENKKSLPAMQSFFYICEYLGVTPQEFFDEGNACPQTLQEFMTEAKKLDSKSMEYITLVALFSRTDSISSNSQVAKLSGYIRLTISILSGKSVM